MENMIIDDNAAIVNGKRQAISGCNNEMCNLPCLRRDHRLRFRKYYNKATAKDCKRQIPIRVENSDSKNKSSRNWQITSRRGKYNVECDVDSGEFRHVYNDGTIQEKGFI